MPTKEYRAKKNSLVLKERPETPPRIAVARLCAGENYFFAYKSMVSAT
jgi:hypothetical protein